MTQPNDHQQITLESKSSFLYSFFFLPPEKRKAIYTLYAFCRQTDDIADDMGPLERKMSRLNHWEAELKKCFTHRVSNYFESVHQVADRFKIPADLFLELIAGVRMDLHGINYKSFDDLKVYCYRVASVVGLMCIQIFGYKDPVIKKYAENLGIALQLTNIIRDVGTDAKMGRYYLPDEELKRFGVTHDDIINANHTDNFTSLMEYQAGRAYEYYGLADDCLPDTEKRNMLVSEIMRDIYWQLLKKIESRRFGVLDTPIKLTKTTKVWIALNTASRIKLLGA